MLYLSKLVKRLAMGRTFGVLALATSLGACAAADEPTAATQSNVSPELAISSLSTPTSAVTISAGDSSQLTATLRDRRGRILSSSRIIWASSAPSVASVTSTGLVYGLTAGTASISASSGALVARVGVTVTPVSVASIHITPSNDTLQVGESAMLGTILRSASGAALTGRVVAWSSSNAAVAAVDANGRVTALSAGAATISASADGVTATASIVALAIAPPAPVPVATVTLDRSSVALTTGQSTSLVATTRDANSAVLTGRTVTWSSTNSGVASVNASGQVIAVAPGSAVVTATSEGKSAAATITVTAPAAVPVATVTLSHGVITVSVGQSEQVDATTKDAANNVLTGRVVTWSSSNTSVATVSSTGNVTGRAGGSATVTATSEGKTASVGVTVNGVVTAAPVATVTLDRSSVTLSTLQATTLVATLRDASNNVLTGRSVTWSSSNSSVATVSGSGNVMAIAAGAATITATSEGKSASASVTVTAVVQPPLPTLLASADFETGSLSGTGFSNPWGTGVDFPSDPTGSGKGRVARISYAPSSGGSMERGIAYSAPDMRYNQTLWMRGYVYFPSGPAPFNAAHNRKILDYQGRCARMTPHRVGSSGELKVSIVDCMNGSEQEVMDPSTGIFLASDVWHLIEIRITTNSADNVRDGVLEIYMNGAATPTYRLANGLGWITEKGSGPSLFNTFIVGFQLTIDSGNPVYQEYRYWDKVAFARTRIGSQ